MTHHKKDKDKEHASPAPAEQGSGQAPQASAPAEAGQGMQAPQVQLQNLQAERHDLLARLQRVSADYLNYQKRVQRDITQARDFANEELIKSLLGVLDDMERALAVARANHPPDDPLLVGMELVHSKAVETLGRFGLTAIQAEGQPFDPERHSALLEQPSDEHPPRTVLKELQRGYQLKGRTIRPATGRGLGSGCRCRWPETPARVPGS